MSGFDLIAHPPFADRAQQADRSTHACVINRGLQLPMEPVTALLVFTTDVQLHIQPLVPQQAHRLDEFLMALDPVQASTGNQPCWPLSSPRPIPSFAFE